MSGEKLNFSTAAPEGEKMSSPVDVVFISSHDEECSIDEGYVIPVADIPDFDTFSKQIRLCCSDQLRIDDDNGDSYIGALVGKAVVTINLQKGVVALDATLYRVVFVGTYFRG